MIAAGKSWATLSDIGLQIADALGMAYEFVEEHGIAHDTREKVVLYRMEKGASFEEDGCAIFCGPFVSAPFKGNDDVVLEHLPGGKAVKVRHVGSYDGLHIAHNAIHEWNEANGWPLTGLCWDVYGEGNDDPAKLVTDIYYQL